MTELLIQLEDIEDAGENEQIEELKQDVRTEKSNVLQLQDENQSAEDKIAQLEEENVKLREKLQELEDQLAVLLEQNEGMMGQMENDTNGTDVAMAIESPAAPAPEGKYMNSKSLCIFCVCITCTRYQHVYRKSRLCSLKITESFTDVSMGLLGSVVENID